MAVDPGEYIVDDVTAAQLIVIAGGGSMTPLEVRRPLDESKDMNGKRILFMRFGGFGDLVLLTPVLREIKRRWPAAHVAVSTISHYAAVLAGLPFVDEIVPFPLPRATAETFDAWIWYENAIERNPRAKTVHMTELFAEIAGLSFVENLRPEYRVKPSELIWSNEAHPRVNGTPRVAVHIGTSAVCRTYPRDQLGLVIDAMIRKNWEVFILGGPGEARIDMSKVPPNLKNMTVPGQSLRHDAAIMNNCDCVLGSDSAHVHIAGALGVPAVALYGPFPWKLRTAHCPTTFAIQGEFHDKGCPCFHHVNAARPQHFPPHCPSKAKGVCEVLASIKPERILSKIEQIMKKPGEIAEVVAFSTRG